MGGTSADDARGQCLGFLSKIYSKNVLAGSNGRTLSVSQNYCRVAAFGSFCGAGLRHIFDHSVPQTAPLVFCRLVLVRWDACAGNRSGSGGRPGYGGSLYLPPVGRVVCDHILGDSSPDG